LAKQSICKKIDGGIEQKHCISNGNHNRVELVGAKLLFEVKYNVSAPADDKDGAGR